MGTSFCNQVVAPVEVLIEIKEKMNLKQGDGTALMNFPMLEATIQLNESKIVHISYNIAFTTASACSVNFFSTRIYIDEKEQPRFNCLCGNLSQIASNNAKGVIILGPGQRHVKLCYRLKWFNCSHKIDQSSSIRESKDVKSRESKDVKSRESKDQEINQYEDIVINPKDKDLDKAMLSIIF